MAISSKPTASEINIELGRASNAPFNYGGSLERQLAEKPSGAIWLSDFIGKSWVKINKTVTNFSVFDDDQYTANASMKFHNGVLTRESGGGTNNTTVVENNLSAATYKVVTTSLTPNQSSPNHSNGVLRQMSDSTGLGMTAKFNENNDCLWTGDLQIFVNGILKHTVSLKVEVTTDGSSGEPT